MLVKPLLPLKVLAAEHHLAFALPPFLHSLLPAVPRAARIAGHLDQRLLEVELRLDHVQPGLADAGPDIDGHQGRAVEPAEDGTQGHPMVGGGGVLEREFGRYRADAEQPEPSALVSEVSDAETHDENANLHTLPLRHLNGLFPRAGKVGHDRHVHQIGIGQVEYVLAVQIDRHRITVLRQQQAAPMQDHGEPALDDPRVLLEVGQSDACPALGDPRADSTSTS